jgi:hypothetical protein
LPQLTELHLAQNRLTGSIPASLLDHANWQTWQNGVCPQQNSYGFDNCSGTRRLSQPKADRNIYKEKYRK